MSTSTEERTAILESHVEEHSHLDLMNTVIEKIVQRGPESVVIVALSEPEAILGTLIGTATLVNLYMTERDVLTERVFELEDELEKYQPSTS